ncbi:MAG: hypothetical protein PUA76_05730 [Bacteroidales bacterium]|nr:hypothetical protein [Bacteroidales bacterium]
MKKQILLGAAAALLLMLAGSCRGNQNVSWSMSYYNFETTLTGTAPSGGLSLRCWGNGPDKARAIENAKKNAVYDVIFKGVKGGTQSYMNKPIVTEVNARERYAEYFDRFFADGGEYRNFVTEASDSDKSRVKSKSNGRENFGVTVIVDRPALQQQLRTDGVIR